jgi:GT2 family glycosyltransferase
MAPAGEICCIVLSHFGAGRTRACARALLGQPITTLYLVDNSADRREAQAIRDLAAELARDGTGFAVRVLCPAQNLGYARGVNAAVADDRAAGGHALYLLLNNDALLPAGAVATLVQALREAPSAALVGPRIRNRGRTVCGLYYWAWLGHGSVRPLPGAMHFLTGACLLLDAAVIGPDGPFDEDFFLYGEDVLLNHQVRRRGGIIRASPELLVEHGGSASSGQGTLFYEYHVARGHLLLARKLGRGRLQRTLYRLGRLVYLPLRALLRCLRQRSLVPARALWLLWRGRPPPAPTGSAADRRRGAA